MATDFPTTRLRVSEPLSSTSLTPLLRQLASALDLLEAVLDLEPRITTVPWGRASAVLRRQELSWEEMEATLRRVAAEAADMVAADGTIDGTEAVRIGALAFLMHRAVSGETPEAVTQGADALGDTVGDWLEEGVRDPALFRRAQTLIHAFAAAFAGLGGDTVLDLAENDLAPVL